MNTNTIHIADTGVLAAIGTPSNKRYRRVRTFSKRNDITFVIPERVYAELRPDTSNGIHEKKLVPVDTAINEGWVRVADPLDYTNSAVSKTMNGIQRYIANADDRPEDEIERADSALGAVASQTLSTGDAVQAYIYTTDIAAGEGTKVILEKIGYNDSVTFVNGFRFIEDLLEHENL